MTEQNSETTESRLSLPAYSGTLLATGFLLLVFLLELIFLPAFGLERPLGLIGQKPLPDTLRTILLVLAPALHATPSHLAANLLVFVPVSILYERWAGVADYLLFVVVTGWFINVGIPITVVAFDVGLSLSIGVSGINHALAAHEAVQQGYYLLAERERANRWELLHFGVAVSVVGYAIWGLLQPTVWVFVSTEAHLYGLLIGAVIAVSRLLY